MPYGSDVLYKVYLKSGSDKLYFKGTKGTADSTWAAANDGYGDSGYEPRELTKDYTHVVLEYKYYGATTPQATMELPVTKKT